MLAPCGANCTECPYEKDCGGCFAISGKPFYIKDFGMDACPLYDCPVNKKGYRTCGECPELPCKSFYDWKDPSMSDEAHIQSIEERTKALRDPS